MTDLKTALFGAGLVSEQQLREVQVGEQLELEAEQAKQRKLSRNLRRSLTILKRTSDPEQFRRQARKLLAHDPDLLGRVIELAHSRSLKRHPGGEALVRLLHQVRQTFKYHELTHAERSILIESMFSTS